jgi:serine/threonine protein kinase/CheY-like chemotaxis protein
MPLILVVDRDERVPRRVRSALGGEGWTVAHVKDVTAAMQSVASEAPDLFVVSADLPTAEHVLSSFARRQGGPGTIALVADTVDVPDGGLPVPDLDSGQDLVLPRSFSEADLRSAVARILETGDRPARPRTDEPKLTSRDIFGDLVAEVEREARGSSPRPAAPPPKPPASPTATGAPAAPTPRPPARSRSIDDDLERKLEQTLSGVLGPAARKPAAPRPPVAQAPAPGAPVPPQAPKPAPKPSPRRPSDDVDKLISDTLSGLEKPAAKRRPAPKDDDPFDLSELEALLDRPRKPRPAAASVPPAVAPPDPPPAPKAPEPPARPAVAPRVPPPSLEIPPRPEEVPFGSLFAEEMREVPDDAAELVEEKKKEKAAPAAGGGDFGQYRLLDRIGVGGMAEVWKARMTGVEGFQKTVAIKRILPHLTDSTDFVEMFIDEAKLAAQLNHANIIHIYDLGKLGDDYYIAMEYVEGENLRSILNRARERGARVPEGVALHVAARLAGALDYAHRKRDFDDRELGLVHRDVSPQNVLVGYEGTIKLCDFGIVKAVSKSSHTQMGALKGKLQYMSPEQAYGKPVDGRSDIFAVGALLFEMLTGRRLFVGESEMEVLEAVRECRVAAPSELAPTVRPEVDAVVRKALAREPEERFQSAGELMRQLEEILSSLRPVPGQRELAVFMARLFDRDMEDQDEPEPLAPVEVEVEVDLDLSDLPEVALETEPEASTPEGPVEAAPAAETALPASAATVPISAADREAAMAGAGGPKSSSVPAAPPPIDPWLDEPSPDGEPAPAKPAAAARGADPKPVEAVPAVGPAVEPEEGGRRGKGLLVAAILLVLIAGAVLAWYLVQRRSGEEAPEVVPVESERAAAPVAGEPEGEDAPAEPGGAEATGSAAGEEAAGGTGPDAAGDEAAAEGPGDGAEAEAAEGALDEDLTEMIDQKVEEELARREEILRRQFEEEERRIQRQLQVLEETQRQEAEAAESEPADPPPPEHR